VNETDEEMKTSTPMDQMRVLDQALIAQRALYEERHLKLSSQLRKVLELEKVGEVLRTLVAYDIPRSGLLEISAIIELLNLTRSAAWERRKELQDDVE